MRRPVGHVVYFIKDFKDEPRRDNVVRKEGTFYFNKNFPPGKKVIIGQITSRRGEISLPYFDDFMTFSKMDMWGSNQPPNKERFKGPSGLEREVKMLGRDSMAFKDGEEAREFAKILRDNNIYCSVSGRLIQNISRPTYAEILYREYLKKEEPEEDRGLYGITLDLEGDDEGCDDIII